MFEKTAYTGSKQEQYQQLATQLTSLITGETNQIANLSNAAALLNVFLEDINWVGFYLLDEVNENELVLGPFQGLPACIRIPLGKGVCGTAAIKKETLVVPNVHQFPGHIACDAASQSEIVVPLIKDGQLLGVLDVDSPSLNRFDNEDALGLQKFVDIIYNS